MNIENFQHLILEGIYCKGTRDYGSFALLKRRAKQVEFTGTSFIYLYDKAGDQTSDLPHQAQYFCTKQSQLCMIMCKLPYWYGNILLESQDTIRFHAP